MKKSQLELLEEKMQELRDIISECADAIADAEGCENKKLFVCTGDYESPNTTTYLLPTQYAVAAFREWQEAARLELINLQKKGK